MSLFLVFDTDSKGFYWSTGSCYKVGCTSLSNGRTNCRVWELEMWKQTVYYFFLHLLIQCRVNNLSLSLSITLNKMGIHSLVCLFARLILFIKCLLIGNITLHWQRLLKLSSQKCSQGLIDWDQVVGFYTKLVGGYCGFVWGSPSAHTFNPRGFVQFSISYTTCNLYSSIASIKSIDKVYYLLLENESFCQKL
jgi:hypothetical protein